MRVYEGDWPEGMIFELRVGADEVESVGDAIEDAITALEAATKKPTSASQRVTARLTN